MMDAVRNFHFIRPWWLLLIPVILGVWWFWKQQTDSLRGWRSQMDPDLLKVLMVAGESGQNRWSQWLLSGCLLAVVCVAGPTWRLEPSPFAEDAAPLMILLKAGDSMTATESSPTRLERAQLKIANLAEVRKGQPLGLIAYAGSAHLVLPPTKDTEVVAQMAAQISPEVMPVPGDRLDPALREAAQLLEQGAAGGSMLVMADQVAGDGDSIAAAREAAGGFPVQFLELTETDTPEAESIRTAARGMGASVQPLTVEDDDVRALAQTASRRSLASVSGESRRWEESGYWLVPIVALLVVISFRRESSAGEVVS